ncbi:hypothetical protein ACFFLM_04095 [Deinococcus oregonensis]|uniref:Uncharacterized protein n=1 Tax=Deinococcus oregonensis TaxID=1805970 RepID=A0ABV6AX31_9DEIO
MTFKPWHPQFAPEFVLNIPVSPHASELPWYSRAKALILLGRETTTLRGYRKLRGRRCVLRYRALH